MQTYRIELFSAREYSAEKVVPGRPKQAKKVVPSMRPPYLFCPFYVFCVKTRKVAF